MAWMSGGRMCGTTAPKIALIHSATAASASPGRVLVDARKIPRTSRGRLTKPGAGSVAPSRRSGCWSRIYARKENEPRVVAELRLRP
jgi:hypothetical protein